MAILKIARMGHPVLRQKAVAVPKVDDPQLRQLVADMLETMDDANGTGLAAPQVHVPLRLVIFFVDGARAAAEARDDPRVDPRVDPRDDPRDDLDENEAEDASADLDEGADEQPDTLVDLSVPLTVLINPVVEPLTEETAVGWEGCLSVPGLAGEVPRYTAIRYRGLDLDGQEIEREATGFHARVVQHETDHLDGILYLQRMTDLSRLAFTTEMKYLSSREPVED